MWSGTNIYAKSQRYLIRILLRLHLAPVREERTIVRAKALIQKTKEKQKQQQSSTTQPQQLSRKQISPRFIINVNKWQII